MRSSIKLFVISFFVVALAAVSASAQRSAQYRAEIPFDFSASGKEMPSGEYRVGLVQDSVLWIRSNDSKHSTFLGFVTANITRDDHIGTLRFIRTGDNYALAEVNMPGYSKKVKGAKTDVKVLSKAGIKFEIVAVNIRRM